MSARHVECLCGKPVFVPPETVADDLVVCGACGNMYRIRQKMLDELAKLATPPEETKS